MQKIALVLIALIAIVTIIRAWENAEVKRELVMPHEASYSTAAP